MAPNVVVQHLPKVLSSHHPILVKGDVNLGRKFIRKRFRVEVPWFDRSDFHEMVKSVWWVMMIIYHTV